MTAYYNEIDEKAAATLRELIRRNLIAPGDVDTRSIEDVTPDDLKSYTQCHFFAGFGVWSYALRQAGWPDDRPVWTGSCPCQPFSAAGKGGGFADERHLWPSWYWLIGERQPPVVFGEQVASKDAEPWLDLVQADLEAVGYALGAVPFPSAGVGAPHIRDRLYWVADAPNDGRADRDDRSPRGTRPAAQSGGELARRRGPAAANDSGVGGLGHHHHHHTGLEGYGGRYQADSGRLGTLRPVAEAGELGGLGNTRRERHEPGRGVEDVGRSPEGQQGEARQRERSGYAASGAGADNAPGPTNGLWRNADWLFCRDGKWRPVEPGTFPLAHGAPARVGRLRGYGNAINAEAATAFIQSYLDAEADRRGVRLTATEHLGVFA